MPELSSRRHDQAIAAHWYRACSNQAGVTEFDLERYVELATAMAELNGGLVMSINDHPNMRRSSIASTARRYQSGTQWERAYR
ncbi:hypothetical protein [Pseudoxanthomonas sp. UTMC 1351]|uniref:hypothetical protein n=1 Tax=Pseudoxanthomonas sp. UTMC 1351 TaxID=2695853 RepID=UPI0034CD8679